VVGSDSGDELDDIVVADPSDADAVDLQERGRGEPAQALVAVDQRVVLDDGVEECRRLLPDVRVGVLAEGRRLRPGCGGPEQPDVADRW
jgi:hypothetical protein